MSLLVKSKSWEKATLYTKWLCWVVFGYMQYLNAQTGFVRLFFDSTWAHKMTLLSRYCDSTSVHRMALLGFFFIVLQCTKWLCWAVFIVLQCRKWLCWAVSIVPRRTNRFVEPFFMVPQCKKRSLLGCLRQYLSAQNGFFGLFSIVP